MGIFDKIKKGIDKGVGKVTEPIKTITPIVTQPIQHIVEPIKQKVVEPIKEKVVDPIVTTTTTVANQTAKTTQNVAQSTDNYAKAGVDVTTETWHEGSAQVIMMATDGTHAIEEGVKVAGEWLDENACYIGLNMALTTGCVAYFTPKPDPVDPGTVTSTSISVTVATMLAKKLTMMIIAKEVGKIITDGIFLIPGVDGNVDRDLLQKIITNCVGTANPTFVAASMSTPAGVGIFVGSVISPIIATLICEGVAPNGLTAAIK
jgi:hypothetical protein